MWANAYTGSTAEIGKMAVYQTYKWLVGGTSLSPPNAPVGCVPLVPLRITETIGETGEPMGGHTASHSLYLLLGLEINIELNLTSVNLK